MASTQLITRPRLPLPTNSDLDVAKWRVLTDAIFPNARSPESIMLALDYCKVRNLDIMRRPVNIVPMWNTQLGRYVETIWPSIGEVETTAARTGQWAGMDEPKFGPDETRTFTGRRKINNEWTDVDITVTFPLSCAVTVYRLIGGRARAFTEPVFWLEAYGRIGGSELPNDQWSRRPRGMIIKVGKSASLRAGFPEESSSPTAEEMEGRDIDMAPTPPTSVGWQPPKHPTAPDDRKRASAEKTTETEQRAVTSEPPATDKRAPESESPDVDQRAATHQTPGPDQRAAADQSPRDPERAGGAESPEANKHAGLTETPASDQRAAAPLDYDMVPHVIEVPATPDGTANDWISYGSTLVSHIQTADSLGTIDEWMVNNDEYIKLMKKEAPKVHTRLQSAVQRQRLNIQTPLDAG
jgi:phage recombination protein Bet